MYSDFWFESYFKLVLKNLQISKSSNFRWLNFAIINSLLYALFPIYHTPSNGNPHILPQINPPKLTKVTAETLTNRGLSVTQEKQFSKQLSSTEGQFLLSTNRVLQFGRLTNPGKDQTIIYYAEPFDSLSNIYKITAISRNSPGSRKRSQTRSSFAGFTLIRYKSFKTCNFRNIYIIRREERDAKRML